MIFLYAWLKVAHDHSKGNPNSDTFVSINPLEAIRLKINITNRDEFSWFRQGNYNLEYILDRFIEKHKPIADRFFNPDELSITNVDSDIAEYVINEFTIMKKPILRHRHCWSISSRP